MCGVTPEIRELIVKARRNGKRVKDIAEMFDVNRKTVWKWCKRTMKVGRSLYRDRSSKPHWIHRKITPIAEESIIILSDSFNWGYATYNGGIVITATVYPISLGDKSWV